MNLSSGLIRRLRRAAGLTQGNLEGFIGVSKSAIGNYEAGIRRLSEETWSKIKEVFCEKYPEAFEQIMSSDVEKPLIIIQSPFGSEITVDEIEARVGDVDRVYVRVDHNAAYWVRENETGKVTLW